MATRPTLFALAAFTLSLVACRDQKVTSYRIPKEKDAQLPAATAAPAAPNTPIAPAAAGGADATMAATPVATASGNALTWTAPATWKSQPPTSMRKATFIIPGGAELAVTAFGGSVGGELANVNRWRGMVQLPAINEADLEAQVTRTEHDGLKFVTVDFVGTGPSAQRLLGAWVPVDGAIWFFKLIGPDTQIAPARSDFTAFIASVKRTP